MPVTFEFAKNQLDTVIGKARVHLYKPIQVAEILYRDRIEGGIELGELDDYRNQSKKWRNDVTMRLVGATSSSSARYQDDLFNPNATPPDVIEKLGEVNRELNGAIEAYIYTQFGEKHSTMSGALDLVRRSDKTNFELRDFIGSFTNSPGLRRSIDKIFEIVVYALFSTLLESLEVKVGVSIQNSHNVILQEFSDFAEKILGLPEGKTEVYYDPKIYRVGVTNAADRGLDMWGNFGVAVQIKHMSLTNNLADEISDSIAADRIVIVCKDSEKNVLVSVLRQFGSAGRIQSVITENELDAWYELALRGQSSELLGDVLLEKLTNEIILEFPSTSNLENFMKERGYEPTSSKAIERARAAAQ